MLALATLAFITQIQTQELSPVRTFELPPQSSTERGSSYLFFSEISNSLIALHPDKAISIINPSNGKLLFHQQLKRDHPERIVLQDNRLFLLDGWISESEQDTGPFTFGLEKRHFYIRVLDLNNYAESDVVWETQNPLPESLPSWISQNNILEPERHLPSQFRRGTHLLSHQTNQLVTITSPGWSATPTSIELRFFPTLELLKSVETPWKYVLQTYLSPDGKTLILQDGNRQGCIVYSLPSIFKVAVIEEPTAYLSFDPDSKWAVTHQHPFDLTYIEVKSPKLIDLSTYKHVLLNTNGESAESSAVSSKLGFAAVLHKNTVRFFSLPKAK